MITWREAAGVVRWIPKHWHGWLIVPLAWPVWGICAIFLYCCNYLDENFDK